MSSSSSEITMGECDLGCGTVIVVVGATRLSPSAPGERSVGTGEGSGLVRAGGAGATDADALGRSSSMKCV